MASLLEDPEKGLEVHGGTSTASRRNNGDDYDNDRKESVARENGDGSNEDSYESDDKKQDSDGGEDDQFPNGDAGEDGTGDPATLTRTQTNASTASRPPDYEVYFGPDDRENPRNWPLWYKSWIIVVVSICTWIVPLYSTSYTASIPALMEEFDVSNTYATLGITTYLVGLGVGCVVFAPLSELYGRQRVYMVCMFLTAVMIIPCGLATSMEQQLACRFVGALFGAAMISNSPGTVVDISDDEHRALYMSLWSLAPLNGPTTGPIIGGVVYENLGWRWCNWIVLILSGAAILAMATLKETYAPTILRRKVRRLRQETDDERWWCRYDTKASMGQVLKTNLSRPFIMAATEPILWGANIWISTLYAILYLCFVAYPIVFADYRGWGPTLTGLSFTGIAIGVLLGIAAEPLLRHIVNAHPKDPETGRSQPEGAARIMTIGAILTPLGQLAFSWTCLPTSIHWAVPIAFGIPFGAGNTLSFIYGANYLGGVYGIYAASALAGNAVIRSFAGGVLPLAGPQMYEAMSPQWAGTLLGLLEVVLIPVPLAFWKYGEKIRARSPLIRRMREDQEKNDNRRAKAEARAAEKRAREEQAEAQARGVGSVDVEQGKASETAVTKSI